jgi:type I restriction enzyme S subunit
MSYPRYPAYKASGVEWFESIPASWQLLPLNRLNCLVQTGPFGSQLHSEDYVTDGYPVVNPSNIVDGRIVPTEGMSVNQELRSRLSRHILRAGDIVFGRRGELGRAALVESAEDGWLCGTGSILVRLNDPSLMPEFLSVYLRLQEVKQHLVIRSVGSTMDNLNTQILLKLAIPIPTISEQQAIAAFLDRKTGELDALIAEKQRLLALLQEQRAALITQAVTKGLDPSAPMKASGVAWLGEIPAHWEVIRLGMIASSIQTGPFGSQVHSGDYVSGGTPLVNPAHIRNGLITPDFDCAVDDQTKQELIRHELKQGDIVFARRGDMGRCALVTEREEGWLCGTGSIRVRLHHNNVPAYIQLVLASPGVKDWLSLESVGATMENLNTSILSRIPVQQPPIAEQEGIVAMSYKIVESINTLCAEVTAGVQYLQEYRTALISAAVTGQIDVRAA